MPTLLPPNATSFERAVETATARIADVPVPLRKLWSPMTCPEDLLPWLAWALSVDNWRSDWPLHVKRARVASAIPIQRQKGTLKSIRDVVNSFGGAVEIIEWWQLIPTGPPHTFQLILTLSGQGGEQATAEYVNDVIEEVSRTKPVRSHFTFTQGVNLTGRIGVIATIRPCVIARLNLTGVS